VGFSHPVPFLWHHKQHPFLKLSCDPRELLSLVQRTKNESVREYIPDE
jgi:hypothetical protein